MVNAEGMGIQVQGPRELKALQARSLACSQERYTLQTQFNSQHYRNQHTLGA
jgi:hypothetical protein